MSAPKRRDDTADVPAWVEGLAMPVWISRSDGIITYVNGPAEDLIGHAQAACLGHFCYLIVLGRTLEGAPFCAPNCRVRRTVASGEAMAPIPMKMITAEGEYREVTLVVINVSRDQLVHCVVDSAHHTRLREFINHVARRAPLAGQPDRPARCNILTAREREILLMLAQDMTQQEIAERLTLSYVTVRNHIQHILAKLGVHSILEAIAVLLIDED